MPAASAGATLAASVNPEAFRRAHPDVFFLDAAQPAALACHLLGLGVLARDERIEDVRRAGEGNMNCTLRVRTDRRSFIVKQARPWVEKYPQFAAPWDRALREAEFYRLTERAPEAAALMPALLAADPEARLLVLQDLGDAGDYTDLYHGGTLEFSELATLSRYLAALHGVRAESPAPPLANREMRALNHAHIFDLPLRPGGGPDLDAITPGLAEVAEELRADAALRAEVKRLGEAFYLADGPCLIHGDFFPGSLVRTPDGPRVIDPEFGFFGRAEFDAAVFLAHLLLAEQPPAVIKAWLEASCGAAGHDESLVLQLAGVEIIRRLIGYAQLPLRCGLEQKGELLRRAAALVREPAAAGLGR